MTLFWLTLFLRCTIYNNVGFVNFVERTLIRALEEERRFARAEKIAKPISKGSLCNLFRTEFGQTQPTLLRWALHGSIGEL